MKHLLLSVLVSIMALGVAARADEKTSLEGTKRFLDLFRTNLYARILIQSEKSRPGTLSHLLEQAKEIVGVSVRGIGPHEHGYRIVYKTTNDAEETLDITKIGERVIVRWPGEKD